VHARDVQVDLVTRELGAGDEVDGLELRPRVEAHSTLLADHAATGGVGREMFKTVIDGDSTGVFQGKIIVRQVVAPLTTALASSPATCR
jgi:hypothetical protein